MWGFFEVARRELEVAGAEDIDKAVRRIPRQWVRLKHPQNTDVGDVEVSVELLPMHLASSNSFKAARGQDAFKPELNAAQETLLPPVRPDDSFAWYRIDQQICWRCKYCFKKVRWYILGVFLLGLACLIAFVVLHKKGYF